MNVVGVVTHMEQTLHFAVPVVVLVVVAAMMMVPYVVNAYHQTPPLQIVVVFHLQLKCILKMRNQ